MRAPAVRASLIVNPRSGRGGTNLSAVLPILIENGWEVEVREVQVAGTASDLAKAAVAAGCEVVIACGGDGTVNEVVNGVAGNNAAVGVLPTGTGNRWAREIGMDLRLDRAAFQLVGAERRRADLGSVAINGAFRRHFLLMAGLGFDGEVMRRVPRSLKQRIGDLAVVLTAIQSLPGAQTYPVDIELDTARWHGRVAEVLVGNTRVYNSITQLTPNAYVDDGRLDVCLILSCGLLSVGRQLGSLLLRHRPSSDSAVSDRAARIRVTTPQVMPLQVDGSDVEQDDVEPGAAGVVYDISVVAGGLTVLVPRTYNGDLFETGPVARSALGLDDQEAALREAPPGMAALRVVAVGVDTVTAVNPANGRVVTVEVDRQTVAADASGAPQEVAAFLDRLAEGDVIRVAGEPGAAPDTICARRLALVSPTPEAS